MTYTFDATLISDLYKDTYGFRPRELFWNDWDAASDDEKQVIWDNLCCELDKELAREKAEQALTVKLFEKLVTACLENGTADRDTALERVIESLGLDEFDLRHGGSYICYELGLPYYKATEFDPICKKLLKKLEEAKSE